MKITTEVYGSKFDSSNLTLDIIHGNVTVRMNINDDKTRQSIILTPAEAKELIQSLQQSLSEVAKVRLEGCCGRNHGTEART